MVLSYLKQCLLISLISLTPLNKPVKGTTLAGEITFERELEVIEISAKKPRHFKKKEFLGFILQRELNTNIHKSLETALLDYSGPKVKISSLKRHGTKSKHCCGKAVDFEWNEDLINYLVSEEGTAWREKHGFTFYIEDTPRSKKLLPYKSNPKYSEFVFENARATGPHIHLNL